MFCELVPPLCKNFGGFFVLHLKTRESPKTLESYKKGVNKREQNKQ